MKAIPVIGWMAVTGLAACGSPPATEAGRAGPLEFVTAYMCGETAAETGMRGDEMVLRVAGTEHVLAPVPSASGAKYAAPGDGPETSFWSKGDRGLLTLDGTTYPECVQTGGEARAEGLDGWTARGQEPGWLLTINGGKAEFTYNYGEQAYSALLPEPRAVEGGIAYSEGKGGLAITVLKAVCADAATGMPYPDTVTVGFSGETYTGCGGDPQALLTGADWVMTELNGAPALEGVQVTLAFDAGAGRVSGRGGCNSYGASYSVGGEGVSFGQGMSTMMACAPAVMAQEQAFLKALEATTAFAIDERGGLVLSGPDGASIRARR